MKRKMILNWLALVSLPLVAWGQGRVVEGQKVESKILKRAIPYSVYLPASYGSSERSYPVLYLLHGYSDDETAWVQFGQVHLAADQGMAAGTVAEMIVADARVRASAGTSTTTRAKSAIKMRCCRSLSPRWSGATAYAPSATTGPWAGCPWGALVPWCLPSSTLSSSALAWPIARQPERTNM
ncbi:MAG: esterase family protein [Cytophagales bacterium]|nr:esterase family protein [Cytophagales bacterium]